MLKRYQRTVGWVFKAADATLISGCWLLSYWSRFYLPSLQITKGLPTFDTYATLTPLVGVLWAMVFGWMRVYESRRLMGRSSEIRMVMRAHSVALLLFIAITYFFEDYRYSRLVMAYFAVLGAVSLSMFRLIVRTGLRYVRSNGHNLRHVLAVGEGPSLEAIIQRLGRYPELGLRVAGVLTPSSSQLTTFAGRSVLGRFDEISQVIEETRVDEVLIALSPTNQREVSNLLEEIKDGTVDIRVVPDVYRYVTLGCEVEVFDGLPILRLNDSPLVGPAALLKRATDVLVAATGILLISPLLGLIALLVKLSSRGPVLYVQERMSLDGRTFNMLKFRSMQVDAEDTAGPVWAKRSDNRRTGLGAFLRKTSLDELPQLWNVLRGDMSLVGPRPERPVFVRQFKGEVPHYMLRHKVKSGLTGWAQVNGWRGDTSLVRRIECDLFYIKNWSYLLDLKILTMTLWRGFVNRNAY